MQDLSFRTYRLTPMQILLLKATVLKGAAALNAWETWQAAIDIENLETDAYLLLPQLYQNLRSHQVESSHMARLKGIYRRNWYANQLQLKLLQQVCASLDQAGIESLVLGDAAFCVGQAEQYRSILSLRLLVHPTDLADVTQHLLQLGWQLDESGIPGIVSFKTASGGLLYLQSRLFWALPQADTDRQVWHHQVSYPDFSPAKGLSPTDQVLERCARLFLKGQPPQLDGIVDLVLLLQHSDLSVDWIRLVTQAQRYQLILPVRNLLNLLQSILQVPIPDWVVPALSQMPIAAPEWLTYQPLASDYSARVRSQLAPWRQRLNQLEPQLIQYRYRPFPGRKLLKSLLWLRKSALE